MNDIRIVLCLLLVSSSQPAWAQQKPLQHDAEHYILLRQHAQRWSQEDREIDAKLANVRAKNSGKSPNIVYILLDDLGFGEIGMPSLDVIRGYSTPNIDRLASEGMSFSRMYTEPTCTPTRAALMTGCYAVRTGTSEAKSIVSGEGLSAWEVTLAEVLSRAGLTCPHG
ncbi:sulfatase-like hydrolase/transferase [Planctomycetota bacterium]